MMMLPNVSLIQSVDQFVRDRFVYVADPRHKDTWRSHAFALRNDPHYQAHGDCDDMVQTCLDELVLRGVEKRHLYRCLVKSPNAHVPDHMVGMVQIRTEMWCIGDTFAEPAKIIDGRVNGHTVVDCRPMKKKRKWFWFTGSRPKRVTNTINMDMRLSPTGVAAIKSHEELRLLAYDDARPNYILRKGDPILGTLTIGYGHTGPEVKVGQVIDEAEAGRLLALDYQFAERATRELVKVQLNQSQFDALVSFIFNVGYGNFSKSTLLKRINARASDDEIDRQFLRWTKSRINGKLRIMGGLVVRREAEALAFTDWDTPPVGIRSCVSV